MWSISWQKARASSSVAFVDPLLAVGVEALHTTRAGRTGEPP